jgi:hypothetical protein
MDLHREARQERRAPICPWCGVTALPADPDALDSVFACDNADCEAYGTPVG